MKKVSNRILAFVLMFALSLTSMIYAGGKAEAADFVTYLDAEYQATANTAFPLNFTAKYS